MIISRQNKLVYVSTPGCGSHSMYELLETQFDGVRAFGTDGSHNRVLPEGITGYTVFTTVRNPVIRIMSAWAQCIWNNRRIRQTWGLLLGDVSFDSFCDFCADNRDELQYPRKDWPLSLKAVPLSVWHQGPICSIRLESIDRELESLLGKVNVPRANKHKYPAEVITVSAKAQRAIVKWAGDDFRRFGYVC